MSDWAVDSSVVAKWAVPEADSAHARQLVASVVPAGGLLQPGGAALALYLGAIPTALAYLLFARGLARIGAGETATLTLAEPLTAAALGVIALGERPSAAAAAGAALVLSGLAVLALWRPREARAATVAPAGAPHPADRSQGRAAMHHRHAAIPSRSRRRCGAVGSRATAGMIGSQKAKPR